MIDLYTRICFKTWGLTGCIEVEGCVMSRALGPYPSPSPVYGVKSLSQAHPGPFWVSPIQITRIFAPPPRADGKPHRAILSGADEKPRPVHA